MRPGRRGAGVLAAVAALLVTAGGLSAQTSRPEVSSISFEGNEVTPDDSLRVAILNRATECRSVVFQILLLCPLGWDRVIDRSYLQPRELSRDMLRLEFYYLERGYREAQVDTAVSRDDGSVSLTFRIDEGRPVRLDTLEVVLTDPIPDSAALRNLPLAVGDPLSSIRLDATRDSLTARLRNQGYAYADALIARQFIPADQPYSARVTFDVDPGPRSRFGAIGVEGNELLDDESIRRMLPFREGTRYAANLVQEGQRNLYSLDIIQTARVAASPDSMAVMARDTIIPVTVTVSEGDLHRVRTALGWTTADCLTAEARWASRNFRGGARRLEARLRLSNLLAPELNRTACPAAGTGTFAELNGQLALELVQPWIFSPRNSFSASAFVERQSLRDVFVREAVGLNLLLQRSIGRRATLSLSYQPQLGRLEAAEVFFCVSFLACLPADIEAFQSANVLAPVGISASRDRRNAVLNPTDGHFLLLDLEHAAPYTGSDFRYSRVLGEASTYHPLGGDMVGAFRARAGVVGRGQFEGVEGQEESLVHPQKRFYAGGASSVRGFAENRLGPRVLVAQIGDLLSVPEAPSATPVCQPEEIVDLSCDPSGLPDGDFTPRAVGGTALLEGNVELRFPLAGDFQGVTFLDMGQVWLEHADLDLGDIEFAPGVGVRYFSPIGPIRVDVGYRFREAERLPVATRGIRPFVAGEDDPDDRIRVRQGASGDPVPIDWVRTGELVFLDRQHLFGSDRSFLSRLQLHISIGQAF